MNRRLTNNKGNSNSQCYLYSSSSPHQLEISPRLCSNYSHPFCIITPLILNKILKQSFINRVQRRFRSWVRDFLSVLKVPGAARSSVGHPIYLFKLEDSLEILPLKGYKTLVIISTTAEFDSHQKGKNQLCLCPLTMLLLPEDCSSMSPTPAVLLLRYLL